MFSLLNLFLNIKEQEYNKKANKFSLTMLLSLCRNFSTSLTKSSWIAVSLSEGDSDDIV